MYHILSYWIHASGGWTFVSDDVPSSFRLTFQFFGPAHVCPCTFSSVPYTHRISCRSLVLSSPSHSSTDVIPHSSSFRHSLSCRLHIKDTGISCTIMSRAKRTPPWPWRRRSTQTADSDQNNILVWNRVITELTEKRIECESAWGHVWIVTVRDVYLIEH